MAFAIIHDLTYFTVTLGLALLVFSFLQLVVFRLICVKRLVSTLIRLILVSVFLSVLMSHLALRSAYSSFPTYVVSTLGAALSATFILGLYGFAVPVCIDRSPSTHMSLVLLESSETGLSEADLRNIYRYSYVFDRRVHDFLRSGFASHSGGKLRLTRKGIVITYAFYLIGNVLRIPRPTAKPQPLPVGPGGTTSGADGLNNVVHQESTWAGRGIVLKTGDQGDAFRV